MTSRDSQRIISLEEGWSHNIKPKAIDVLEEHLNRVSVIGIWVLNILELFILFRYLSSVVPVSKQATFCLVWATCPGRGQKKRGSDVVRRSR